MLEVFYKIVLNEPLRRKQRGIFGHPSNLRRKRWRIKPLEIKRFYSSITYGALMKNISYVLFFLCFAFPAFAQGNGTFIDNDIIGVDVAFQIGGTHKSSLHAHNMTGIGGRVGYRLGSIIFLDGEILHEPKGLRASDEQTVVLGGIRLGTIFDDTVGIFAKMRAGAFRINAEDNYLMSEKDFHPIVDYGIIAEYYVPFNNRPTRKLFTRFDVGGWMVPFGNTLVLSDYESDHSPIYKRLGTQHFFAIEVGLGVRF